MEAASLWAGVRFTARNGSPEALLTDAAGQGLHLYGISSLPGGFCAHCAAWQYRRLAALARHRRVRLRVEKRKGLYFLLRPLLRRKGLWVGLATWGLVLVWLQGLIWAIDYSSLTTGQQARASAVLRSCGLQPGTVVTEELLRTGEYALLVFAVCCITACEACRLTEKKAQNATPTNKKRSAACKPPQNVVT